MARLHNKALPQAWAHPHDHLFCDAGKEFILQEKNERSCRTYSINDPALEYKDQIRLHHYVNPPGLPDFNPIENVWRMLKQQVKKWKAETEIELLHAIQMEWA